MKKRRWYHGIPQDRKTEDRQEDFHKHRKENEENQHQSETIERGHQAVNVRRYHEKNPGKMKIRYAINIESDWLDEIEDVSQALNLPRSKVTRALLRYGLDNITTNQIYELGKE